MTNNNQNQPNNNQAEIEMDETALEEVVGGTQYDAFLKFKSDLKILPAVQHDVKLSIDPNLHK
jgi:hypothetical protein